MGIGRNPLESTKCTQWHSVFSTILLFYAFCYSLLFPYYLFFIFVLFFYFFSLSFISREPYPYPLHSDVVPQACSHTRDSDMATWELQPDSQLAVSCVLSLARRVSLPLIFMVSHSTILTSAPLQDWSLCGFVIGSLYTRRPLQTHPFGRRRPHYCRSRVTWFCSELIQIYLSSWKPALAHQINESERIVTNAPSCLCFVSSRTLHPFWPWHSLSCVWWRSTGMLGVCQTQQPTQPS